VLLLGNDFNNLRGLLGSMPSQVGEKRSISAKMLPVEPLAANHGTIDSCIRYLPLGLRGMSETRTGVTLRSGDK
jgi:hypothetical protein